MPHAPLPLPPVLFANATCTAPAALGPLCTTARTQRLFLYARPHAPIPPPTVASQHAQRLFSVQGSHPFLGRPFFFLPTCSALRRAPRLLARALARTRTHGRPTNERRDVRSAGVADWITARGGNTEHTLTAAVAPSPRDPYRHALTRRPPQKVWPFSFLNYPSRVSFAGSRLVCYILNFLYRRQVAEGQRWSDHNDKPTA